MRDFAIVISVFLVIIVAVCAAIGYSHKTSVEQVRKNFTERLLLQYPNAEQDENGIMVSFEKGSTLFYNYIPESGEDLINYETPFHNTAQAVAEQLAAKGINYELTKEGPLYTLHWEEIFLPELPANDSVALALEEQPH